MLTTLNHTMENSTITESGIFPHTDSSAEANSELCKYYIRTERTRAESEGATGSPAPAAVPPLSREIQQNLARLRRAQGRRQFSSRIQTILSNSHARHQHAGGDTVPAGVDNTAPAPAQQPLSELERLCLEDSLDPEVDHSVTLHSGEGSASLTSSQLSIITNTVIDFNGNLG